MVSIELAEILIKKEFSSWGAFSMSLIPGGLTNQNLLIETSIGEKFVARLPGDNTDVFGIDRQREYEVSRVAWEIGIAPEPIAFLAKYGILITRFVEAKSIDTDDTEAIRIVAKLLKKLHSAPSVSGEFNLPSVINDYIKTAKRFNVKHPSELDEALDFAAKIIDSCSGSSRALVPCHNDLLPANFLQGKDDIYLIDWEYAGMGDPYVDLGNCAANFCMNDEDFYIFMNSYLNREPSDIIIAQLNLFRILSDLREALWAYVQIGVSKLDVDFNAYGVKHLNRFLLNSKSDNFKNWIKVLSS